MFSHFLATDVEAFLNSGRDTRGTTATQQPTPPKESGPPSDITSDDPKSKWFAEITKATNVRETTNEKCRRLREQIEMCGERLDVEWHGRPTSVGRDADYEAELAWRSSLYQRLAELTCNLKEALEEGAYWKRRYDELKKDEAGIFGLPKSIRGPHEEFYASQTEPSVSVRRPRAWSRFVEDCD